MRTFAFPSARPKRLPRVLMIGTSPLTQGGISTVVREMLASPLARRCHLKYISTHCDGGLVRKVVASLLGATRVWVALLLQRPSLLHVHMSSRASFWRKLITTAPAYLLRVPVLIHLHGSEFREFYGGECGRVGRRLVATIMKRSARVVALSQGWKDWLDTQFPTAQTVVIPNSVTFPAPLGQSHRGDAVLLFMGRIGERKGAYDLLRAVAQLGARAPKLVLAGDGDIARARALAEELGVSALVETPGWIGFNDKERLLREASIYVLPSYNEGLPLSVLEAMSYGLPVVTTPVGGIPDAVTDGREGFLVAPGDVSMLALRLRELLEAPARAAQMGSLGRSKIQERFSTAAVVERWLTLYAELGVKVEARETT